MITRDSVQGFIDGHKAGGHELDCLRACVKTWLEAHPDYDTPMVETILDDLDSYRK